MEKPSTLFLKQVTLACRYALCWAAFFSLFINIFMLATTIYMLQLYDRVLASHSYDTLFYLTLITLIALLVLGLLDMARARIMVHVSLWVDQMLSPEALTRSADELLKGRNYGAQAMRDITNIRQFIASAGIYALFDSPWVPIYLIFIFILHPILGFLATCGAVILFALAIVNEMVTYKLLAEANTQSIVAQRYIDTSLRNAEVIQAMGMMPNVVNHWQKKNAPVLQLQTIASNRASAILATSKFMRLVLQVLMLGVGAYLVIQNQLTAGAMIAGSILLARALAPVEQAIGVWKQLLSVRQAYKRVRFHLQEDSRPVMDITLPTPQGALSLENVIYRAPQMEKPILYGISLKINPGEMIAVIGPSGAGKSTLARLIVGAFKATAGDIRLDGADVYTWHRADFGRNIGYLPQDVELFTGTVKDNIARLGDIEDAAVIAAAQLAGVHDMILHLPQGYDTVIGMGNFTLSGGQRQRIALARALYKQPCLLLLDEPNSNLDNAGDEALLRALLAMRDKKVTQIIIAHRPSIVQHVDQIIVLNEGRVQMAGPREQILAQLQPH